MKPEEAIKAIKGLENIIEYWTYRPDEVITAKLAIQALEKQVPKKVEKIRLSSDYKLAENSVKEGECPKCGETMTGNVFGLYCGVCGQSLDWRYEK